MQYAVPIMDQALSDEELMLRYREGDAMAFETLYRRHRKPLYRYFFRQCQNEALAEELYQDVWMKLIQAKERYQVQAKFQTYLYHIAHNRLIDHYRRTRNGIPVSFNTDDPLEMDNLSASKVSTPDHQADLQQRFEQFVALVEKLPEAQREAFLLREQADMSLDEIAETTGVNRETAKSRLRYAISKLRREMGLLL